MPLQLQPDDRPGDRRSEHAQIIREMIRHEDELRSQRLGWFLTLNGFLFAALAFAWKTRESTLLVCLLAVTGVFVGISAAASMTISQKAIERLRNWADDNLGGDSKERPPIIGVRSEHLPTWSRVLVPWGVLPRVLAFVWLVLLVLRIADVLE